MWTLGSHSLRRNLINDLGREARRAREVTQGHGRLLRTQPDGMWLLKCHIEAVWCAGYSRRTVSIMACVVMTVCLYGLASRERMDALRPPVTSPSQQRRSGNTRTSQENLIRGTVTLVCCLFLAACPPKSGESQQQRHLVSPLTKMLSFQHRRVSAGEGWGGSWRVKLYLIKGKKLTRVVLSVLHVTP